MSLRVIIIVLSQLGILRKTHLKLLSPPGGRGTKIPLAKGIRSKTGAAHPHQFLKIQLRTFTAYSNVHELSDSIGGITDIEI